jgi:hypothetical protein
LRAVSPRCAGVVAGGEECAGDIGAAGELGSDEAVVGEEIAAGMMNNVTRVERLWYIRKIMYMGADSARDMVEAAEGRCLRAR